MIASVVRFILSLLLPHDHIPGPNGTIYMRRYYLWRSKTGGRWVRIHEILLSDEDRHFHDHPWDFTSFILSGGYTEHTPNGTTVHRPFSLIRRKAEDLHKLELTGPAWTFVVTGDKRRDWGFQTENGWIHWEKYFSPNREVV